MKNLKYGFLFAALPMAMSLNTKAQVKIKAPTVLKIDTVLLRRQLRAETRVSYIRHDFAAQNATTSAPIPVVKISNPLPTPAFQFRQNVTSEYSPIHVTPLPSTTFKPVMITSPGGTVSSINSDGMIIKKH